MAKKKKEVEEDLDDDLLDDFGDEAEISDNNDYDLLDNENDFFDYNDEKDTALNKHNDLLKQLTNFDPFLKILVTEWLGLVWDEQKEEYREDENNTPVMNVKGARWCINFLRVYARDNNVITNLDQDNFNWIIEDIIDVIFLNLGDRMTDFGIKYNGDILLIGNQLLHASQMVLVGSSGNKSFHDLLAVVTNRQENITMSPQGQINALNGSINQGMPMQKLNFFQKLNPRNWGKT